jgi:hypothetical protein
MESAPAPVVSLPTSTFLPSSFGGAAFFEIALYVILIIYLLFTLTLLYHWYTYANSKITATATYTAYFVITLPMIATLLTTVVIL